MQRRASKYGSSMFLSGGDMRAKEENGWIVRQFLVYAGRLVRFIELEPVAVAFFVEILPQTDRWALLEKLGVEAPGSTATPARLSVADIADVLNDRLTSKDAALSAQSVRKALSDAILRRLAELDRNPGDTEGPAGRQLFEEMDELVSLFKLSYEELSIVVFCYCYGVFNYFEELCDSIRTHNQLRFLSACVQTQPYKAAMLLNPYGNLRRYGIIEKLDSYRCWLFRLTDKVQEYLSGSAGRKFAELFCEPYYGDCYDLATYDVPAEHTDILSSLVKAQKPFQILLYGEPGTGKTEYARSLIRESGKQTWVFIRPEEQNGSTISGSIAAAGRAISSRNGVLIVDEADWILNSGYSFFGNQHSPEKGEVNSLLDHMDTSVIWIVNDVSWINPSTLRRFAFSLRFKKPGTKRKKYILNHYLNEKHLSGYISDDEIDGLSRYHINPANISDAVEVSSCLQNSGKEPGSLADTLSIILGEKERLQDGSRLTKKHQVLPQFDISLLNTDHDAAGICNALSGFAGRGCASMLFWGPPGTGKTALARYIALTLSLDLLEKRASDLVSMWVGETEKNIRRAFEEAEETGAILLLDETDSFLRRRDKAAAHYLVTETNELLKQMETFDGILICCTNLLENLDRASLRRFVWKVEFRETLPQHRLELVRAYFPHVTFSRAAAKEIESIEGMTPGDVAVVYNRYRLMEVKELNGERLTGEIRCEIAYRKYGDKREIGFRQR